MQLLPGAMLAGGAASSWCGGGAAEGFGRRCIHTHRPAMALLRQHDRVERAAGLSELASGMGIHTAMLQW
jgi:hypothetical protein